MVATDAASSDCAAAIAAELGATLLPYAARVEAPASASASASAFAPAAPARPRSTHGVPDAPGLGLRLLVAGEGCSLLVSGFSQPLRIAMDDGDIRRRAASGRRLELLRACGWPLHDKRILDATAGFGRDAFVLACAGATVDMIEREPLLLVLLRDALARAGQRPPAGGAVLAGVGPRTPRLFAGDAATRMTEVFDGHDVIYLDPMFEREGSALPQRDAQVLARVARPDPGTGLLASALALRPARVVVKRARTQPPLAEEPSPHHRIVGRRVRFDVYVPD